MCCAVGLTVTHGRRSWLLLDPTPNRFDLFRGQWLAPDAARLSVAAELTAQCFGPDLCQSAWAPSTRKTYAAWCALFAAFSERHGVEPLPLHPSVTVRWLDHLSDYLSGSSVNLALCALLAWSKLNNLVDPLVSSPVIKLAWQGIRRTRMSRARPQKAPLSETIILAIYQLYWKRFEFVDPIDCLVETRTVGWLLLGFEIAPRVAELCNLTVCCYIPLLDGSAIILILEAKNNRDLAACLSKVFIAPAMHHLRQFPSAAAFLRLVYIPLIVRLGVRRHPACTTNVDSVHRCQVCPKLFPTFPSDGRPTGTMSKSNITEEIRQWLSALGVPGDQLQQYSGISLRRATATMAAMMKVAPETTSRHFRYSTGTLGIYADKPASERFHVSQAAQQAYARAPDFPLKPLDENDDFCYVCERGVQRELLLCCESCPQAAHLRCVSLPAVPAGAWYCDRCLVRSR